MFTLYTQKMFTVDFLNLSLRIVSNTPSYTLNNTYVLSLCLSVRMSIYTYVYKYVEILKLDL